MQCSEDLHQASAASFSTSEVPGLMNGDLPGTDPRGPGTVTAASPTDYFLPRATGLHSQQNKVGVRALSLKYASGSDSGCYLDETVPTRGESTTDNQRLQTVNDKGNHHTSQPELWYQ